MSDALPEIGKKAPAFTLPSHQGGKVKLADFKGKKHVVLYFYPRDMTPGCTTEACDFRDFHADFLNLDVEVLGVSTDDIDSHIKFKDKHDLPFQLLADVDHAICEKYGVWVEKNMYGKKSMGVLRATFLIDKEGKIAHIWPKVKVEGHVNEVLETIKNLA